MGPRVFRTLDDVMDAEGEDLGASSWLSIEQDRVDRFADVTGDHQWIHVDPERARSAPLGGTIAHGYLTLSLVPALGAQVFRFDLPGARLNYGTDKVRFPAPVRTGSRIRAQVTVQRVEQGRAGLLVAMRHTIDIEGGSKPACVADTLTLLVSDGSSSS